MKFETSYGITFYKCSKKLCYGSGSIVNNLFQSITNHSAHCIQAAGNNKFNIVLVKGLNNAKPTRDTYEQICSQLGQNSSIPTIILNSDQKNIATIMDNKSNTNENNIKIKSTEDLPKLKSIDLIKIEDDVIMTQGESNHVSTETLESPTDKIAVDAETSRGTSQDEFRKFLSNHPDLPENRPNEYVKSLVLTKFHHDEINLVNSLKATLSEMYSEKGIKETSQKTTKKIASSTPIPNQTASNICTIDPIFNGHRYKKYSYKDGATFYRCQNFRCSGRGILIGDTFTNTKGHDNFCTNESDMDQDSDNTFASSIEFDPSNQQEDLTSITKIIDLEENCDDNVEIIRTDKHMVIDCKSPSSIFESMTQPLETPVQTQTAFRPPIFILDQNDESVFTQDEPSSKTPKFKLQNASVSSSSFPSQSKPNNISIHVLPKPSSWSGPKYPKIILTPVAPIKPQPPQPAILKLIRPKPSTTTASTPTEAKNDLCVSPFAKKDNSTTDFTIISSSSGADRQTIATKYYNEGYTYQVVQYAKTKTYYKCATVGCPARATLSNDVFDCYKEHIRGCLISSLLKTPSKSYIKVNRIWIDQNGFQYKKKCSYKHNIYLNCKNLSCPARAIVSEDGMRFIKLHSCTNMLEAETDDHSKHKMCSHNMDIDNSIKYIKSSKGKDILCYNLYQYTIHRIAEPTIYYRCRRRDCKGRGKLVGSIFEVTKNHLTAEGKDSQCISCTDQNTTIPTTKSIHEGVNIDDDSSDDSVSSATLENEIGKFSDYDEPTENFTCGGEMDEDSKFSLLKDLDILSSGTPVFLSYQRYKNVPFFEGFLYKCVGSNVYFCRIATCSGRAYLKETNQELCVLRGHNHEKMESEADAIKYLQDCIKAEQPQDGDTIDADNSETSSEKFSNGDIVSQSILRDIEILSSGTPSFLSHKKLRRIPFFEGYLYKNISSGVYFCRDPSCPARAYMKDLNQEFCVLRAHNHVKFESEVDAITYLDQPQRQYKSVMSTIDMTVPDFFHTPENDIPGLVYVPSAKCGLIPYYEGHLYLVDRHQGKNLYLSCRKDKCPARAILTKTCIKGQYRNHNHPPQRHEFLALETRYKLKQAIIANPDRHPRQTYVEFINKRLLEIEEEEKELMLKEAPYNNPNLDTTTEPENSTFFANKYHRAFPTYRSVERFMKNVRKAIKNNKANRSLPTLQTLPHPLAATASTHMDSFTTLLNDESMMDDTLETICNSVCN
ncbi:uncharacterized protein LOC135926041 isoform X2 [Gordionus sp. m RMFG-2023]|uniref:uncharacterized protein LOC135926041 isoform X2 n=1 Tax=Gordionus sp. m RMFG-2023 TaxID=3053472 RepID=UPI0031FC6859